MGILRYPLGIKGIFMKVVIFMACNALWGWGRGGESFFCLNEKVVFMGSREDKAPLQLSRWFLKVYSCKEPKPMGPLG
jgi:hypothetical protein